MMMCFAEPPGAPRIYKAMSNITAGLMQRITCTSTGGHPPATLTWYRAGKKVKIELNILHVELKRK
jgi:hypothetical protein